MHSVFRPVGVIACRALHVRKKMAGENMPVQMIGDILAAELSHMQPYIRFCSCQINGATLLQTRIDNEPDFKNFLKVRCGEEWTEVKGEVLAEWQQRHTGSAV